MSALIIKSLEEAKANFRKVWSETLLNLEEFINCNVPIDKKWLSDPDHPLTALILYIWTMESSIYSRLNEVQRENDTSYSPMLGPYAFLLTHILNNAMKYRTDIDLTRFTNGVYLYRGMSLSYDYR